MTVDATTQFLEDSMGNFTRPAGGGGSTPVTTTIAGINTLATAGSLVPGTLYKVTDWVSGSGSLPGPNTLWVEADDAHTPSKFVRVETPLGAIGPSDGEFIWNLGGSTNFMNRLHDNLGNDIIDSGTGLIDNFVWGTTSWANNTLRGTSFLAGYAQNAIAAAAGFHFSSNTDLGASSVDLTGYVSGNMIDNFITSRGSIQATITVSGNVFRNAVDSDATFTVSPGGSATGCKVSAGAAIDTGAFAATNVVVAGAITQALTADNANTYAGFGLNTLV